MKIAVDVDDVLTHTGAEYIEYHNKKYGTKLKPEQFYDFDYLVPYGLKRKEGYSRILSYIEERALEIVPMEGAKEALEQLKKNHDLIVITGRAKNVMEKTRQWIELNYPGIFSAVYCTDVHQLNGGKDKGEVCKQLGVKLLVEDYLRYAQECAREGIRVLVISQPWNVNERIENALITRVDNWKAVLDEIGSIKIGQ